MAVLICTGPDGRSDRDTSSDVSSDLLAGTDRRGSSELLLHVPLVLKHKTTHTFFFSPASTIDRRDELN